MVTTSGLRDGLGEPGASSRNEYLAAENRILRAKLPSRIRLSNSERIHWPRSENGSGAKRYGRLPLWPNLIPSWLGIGGSIAQKFDGSKHRQYPGRPPVSNRGGSFSGPHGTRKLWLGI